MSSETATHYPMPTQEWLASLPHARIHRPDTVRHVAHYYFWRLVSPIHPYLRDAALALGLVHFDQFLDEKGRQKFLLGIITADHTPQQVIEQLVAHGYGNHFIAWKDNGEVASLRLLDGFTHQYHVRIFQDGEVRAHYELTPEAHPIKHYYEVGMEARAEYFAGLLGHMLQRA